MKSILEHETTGDSQLVVLCLSGNRNAFAQIVERYQSVICAIAYNACGDIGRSEDLAQDTFIAAWRQLGGLKEPEKLKAWLCGIARNLANQSVRQQQRTPTAMTVPVPPETPAATATPSDQAISREEESLLWRTLEGIPENYRAPMILYYRENRSTQAVAAALDLSEKLVRKRLSRGREMLTERVAKTVESALLKSAPGKAFTVAVLGALPPVTTATKAAAIGAIAAKGGATAKGAGSAGLFKAVLGPVLWFLTPFYFGYKMGMEDARSAEERRFLRRLICILIAAVVLYIVTERSLGKFGEPLAHSHPALYAGLSVGITIAYLIFVVILVLWSNRHERMMARAQAPLREPAFEYRSKLSLLGLPLVHIRMRGGSARGPVKAWFAAGDSAIGVIFAFGGMAVAPVSFGGFAVGLLTLGGFSFGPWALGGFALGWQAIGGCAVGWLAAHGGVAVAHGVAQGGAALAAHANDAATEAFFKNNIFSQNALAMERHPNWFNWAYLMFLLPPVLWWQVLKKKRRAKKISSTV